MDKLLSYLNEEFYNAA